jgi:hypothetical protein
VSITKELSRFSRKMGSPVILSKYVTSTMARVWFVTTTICPSSFPAVPFATKPFCPIGGKEFP